MENPQLFAKKLQVALNHSFLKQNIKDDKDDYVMYILINEDLKDVDKIITQCCHSSCKVIRVIENLKEKPDYYMKWINNSEDKVLLKATEEDLIYCISQYANTKQNLWCQYILDINTEPDNQNNQGPILITAVAFVPMMRKKIPKLIKKLCHL